MRIGYAIAGRQWMYTTVVAARRRSGAAPLGGEPVGPAPAARHRAWRARHDSRWRWPGRPGGGRGDRRRGCGAAGVTDAHALVVIHVSAGNAFRRWPATAFEDLAASLVQRDGQRRVVVTAGPSDADAARRIATPRARGWVTRPTPFRDCGEFDSDRAPRAGGAGLGVHWGRQRAAARGRRDPDADCGAAGADAGGTVAALARPPLVQPRWWSWRCPAGRATSECASPGISGA